MMVSTVILAILIGSSFIVTANITTRISMAWKTNQHTTTQLVKKFVLTYFPIVVTMIVIEFTFFLVIYAIIF